MNTKIDRIKADIEGLARFNATPGEGLTRLSFTKEDREARQYIKEAMISASLEVLDDTDGNIIGRRRGINNLPPVMIGSHFDSVKNGGNFDGQGGVVAALEVARVLNEKGIVTNRPMEFIALVEEEGGRFKGPLYGSRAITGSVSLENLKSYYDSDGTSMFQAMEDFGLKPSDINSCIRKPGDIHGFLELHIEQGPILESGRVDIGIVDTIVGISQFEVEIFGRPDHAGTTPMNMRADALVLAGIIIQKAYESASQYGEGSVATVGNLKLWPGAANIVPGKVLFSVDIRSREGIIIKSIEEDIKKSLELHSPRLGVIYNIIPKLSVEPVKIKNKMIKLFEEKAKEIKLSYKPISSGAGHDAMVMSQITDIGLVFVPSKGGRSHCPEEWTDYEQLQRGIELLYETAIALAEEIT